MSVTMWWIRRCRHCCHCLGCRQRTRSMCSQQPTHRCLWCKNSLIRLAQHVHCTYVSVTGQQSVVSVSCTHCLAILAILLSIIYSRPLGWSCVFFIPYFFCTSSHYRSTFACHRVTSVSRDWHVSFDSRQVIDAINNEQRRHLRWNKSEICHITQKGWFAL